jgi:hypothetical protein
MMVVKSGRLLAMAGPCLPLHDPPALTPEAWWLQLGEQVFAYWASAFGEDLEPRYQPRRPRRKHHYGPR